MKSIAVNSINSKCIDTYNETSLVIEKSYITNRKKLTASLKNHNNLKA